MTANCTLRHCLRCGKLKRRPTPPQNLTHLTFSRWDYQIKIAQLITKPAAHKPRVFDFRWMRLSLRTSNFIPCLSKPNNWHRYCVDSATSLSRSEIAPEPAGHGLKCEAYNRGYEQSYGSS